MTMEPNITLQIFHSASESKTHHRRIKDLCEANLEKALSYCVSSSGLIPTQCVACHCALSKEKGKEAVVEIIAHTHRKTRETKTIDNVVAFVAVRCWRRECYKPARKIVVIPWANVEAKLELNAGPGSTIYDDGQTSLSESLLILDDAIRARVDAFLNQLERAVPALSRQCISAFWMDRDQDDASIEPVFFLISNTPDRLRFFVSFESDAFIDVLVDTGSDNDKAIGYPRIEDAVAVIERLWRHAQTPPMPPNLVMRQEALDHFRVMMRRRDNPKEVYFVPFRGDETPLEALAAHRALHAEMPAHDPQRYTVQMVIMKRGTVTPGKTFESIVAEQGEGVLIYLPIPGLE